MDRPAIPVLREVVDLARQHTPAAIESLARHRTARHLKSVDIVNQALQPQQVRSPNRMAGP
jgi:hypothetical protein